MFIQTNKHYITKPGTKARLRGQLVVCMYLYIFIIYLFIA